MPKAKLLTQIKNGLTGNDEEKDNIIANYFYSQSYKNAEPLLKIKPTSMRTSFTQTEIETACKGDRQKENTQGLICALQKPGQSQNLRPIILVSVLRKILAVCIIKRIGERLDNKIPRSQAAAYRKGRSTTGHIFSKPKMKSFNTYISSIFLYNSEI